MNVSRIDDSTCTIIIIKPGETLTRIVTVKQAAEVINFVNKLEGTRLNKVSPKLPGVSLPQGAKARKLQSQKSESKVEVQQPSRFKMHGTLNLALLTAPLCTVRLKIVKNEFVQTPLVLGGTVNFYYAIRRRGVVINDSLFALYDKMILEKPKFWLVKPLPYLYTLGSFSRNLDKIAHIKYSDIPCLFWINELALFLLFTEHNFYGHNVDGLIDYVQENGSVPISIPKFDYGMILSAMTSLRDITTPVVLHTWDEYIKKPRLLFPIGFGMNVLIDTEVGQTFGLPLITHVDGQAFFHVLKTDTMVANHHRSSGIFDMDEFNNLTDSVGYYVVSVRESETEVYHQVTQLFDNDRNTETVLETPIPAAKSGKTSASTPEPATLEDDAP